MGIWLNINACAGLWGSLAILARLGRVDSGSNPGSPTSKRNVFMLFGCTHYTAGG